MDLCDFFYKYLSVHLFLIRIYNVLKKLNSELILLRSNLELLLLNKHFFLTFNLMIPYDHA